MFQVGANGTHQVRALTRISQENVCGLANEQTRIALGRVMEADGLSDVKFVYGRDSPFDRLATTKETLQRDPKLAADKREAGQHHEFRKVAARSVFVGFDIDRKISPPLRLLLFRTAIGESGGWCVFTLHKHGS